MNQNLNERVEYWRKIFAKHKSATHDGAFSLIEELQAENSRLRAQNGTNTSDYTLREALKAAQDELAEARHVEMRARIHLDEQCKRNELLQAKLLDREKRLRLIREAPAEDLEAICMKSCNLDLTLEE